MQSNCTYSDFGTIHVSATLPFALEERKWQLRLRLFTPALRSRLVIKEDAILTRHRGPTGLNLSVLLVQFLRGLWFHNEKPPGVSGMD